jgi:hypothetical protein
MACRDFDALLKVLEDQREGYMMRDIQIMMLWLC